MRLGKPFGTVETRGIECGTGIGFGGGGVVVSGFVERQHTEDSDPFHGDAHQLQDSLVVLGDSRDAEEMKVVDYSDPTNPVTTGYIKIPSDPNGYGTDPINFDFGILNNKQVLIAPLNNDSNNIDQTFAIWDLSSTTADNYHQVVVFNCNDLLGSVSISQAQGLTGCSLDETNDVLLLGHKTSFVSTDALLTAVDLSDPSNPEIIDYVPTDGYDGNTLFKPSNNGAYFTKTGTGESYFVEYDGGIQTTSVQLVFASPEADKVSFDGDYIYGPREILDITDPKNPTNVGELPTFEGAYPNKDLNPIQLPRGDPRDGVLYAELREGTNVGVRALDVSDPTNPTVLSDTLTDPNTRDMMTSTKSTRINTTVSRGLCLARTVTETGNVVTGLLEHDEGRAYIPFEDSPEPEAVVA